MNSEINFQPVKENFIISKIYGAFYEIYSPNQGIKRAVLKGKLRLEKNETRHPFVVGDKVLAENQILNSDWLILNKEPRKNFLIRKSSNTDAHVLCANVDFVIIIASLEDPETKDGFIDRSITAIYHSGANPIILFNKKDLVLEEILQERTEKYTKLGYKVFSISCKDKDSLKEFIQYIEGKTSYLVGNSGVGKSTIINLILDQDIQKVNEISESTHKGKHTTTNSTALFLPKNTVLIDSPGIKEWGLMHLKKGAILESFPEFHKLQKKCKNPSCCNADSNCILLENFHKLEEERRKSLESMLEGLEIPYRIRVGNYKSGKIRKIKRNHWED